LACYVNRHFVSNRIDIDIQYPFTLRDHKACWPPAAAFTHATYNSGITTTLNAGDSLIFDQLGRRHEHVQGGGSPLT
jgi:hypothetical protein